MRALAAFIMRGRGQAVAVVACAAGLSLPLPLVSMISSAALALVALRKGLTEGAWVFGLALAVTTGIGAVTSVGPYLAFGFGLLLWLPILMLAFALRETGSLAFSLELAFGLACVVVAGIYLFIADPVAMWAERLTTMLQPILANAPPEIDTTNIKANIVVVSHYMSGMVVGGSVLTLVLSLFLGRWWQDALFNPGGFRAEFVTLRLHGLFAYSGLALFATAMLLSGASAEIAWNLSIQFLLLFMISGFSVLHCLLGAGGKRFWLTGLYILLFFIPHMLLPVALVGVSDVWLDWRKRRGVAT